MNWVWLSGLIGSLSLSLTACDLSEHIEPETEAQNPPVISAPPAIEDADAIILPAPVQEKLNLIAETLETNSIRRLVRLAEGEEDFRSNFGDISHFDHWYILRRAGLDPIEKTKEILAQPFGVKDFGAEKFYIWPEFAARPIEELDYNRLTFKERATLLELVSEDGVRRIENGEAYPGFRLAIREDGSWAYLLQDN